MEQNPTITAEGNLNLDKNQKFKFEFNLDEIYVLGVGLSKLPYETVKPIIDYVQTSLNSQVREYIDSVSKDESK